LLYQVATAGLSPADIATPIRSLFRLQPNVRVLLGEVVGVRPASREIVIGRNSLPYDYLILATGAQHSYFGMDDWAANAPGLKTIEDAIEVRRRLLTAFERAESADDPAERAAWMTFVIVGGGPTGVELAGAIVELARHGLEREFTPHLHACNGTIFGFSTAFPTPCPARARSAAPRMNEASTGLPLAMFALASRNMRSHASSAR
jgi:NADH:ubiquinone reductase (H+-translocating)